MSIKTSEIQCVSLLDQTLKTGLQIINLVEGEIFTAHFRNPQHFRQYVEIGVLAEAPAGSVDKKIIPVLKMPTVLITEDGQELPLSSVKRIIPQQPIDCEGYEEYTQDSIDEVLKVLPKLKEIIVERIN